MRSRVLIAVVALVASSLACGSGDGDAATADAAVPDAEVVSNACPAAGPAGQTGAQLVYLNFEGVAITPGPTDATTNTSSIVSSGATVPAAFDGDADRATIAQATETHVRTLLGPYDIGVVTARPSAGPYAMVVVGGVGSDLGLPDNINSIAASGCGDPGNPIGYVFETTRDPVGLAGGVAFVVGLSFGIPADQDARSCTCASCLHSELCQMIDETVESSNNCNTETSHNPARAWSDTFGCRP